MKIVLLLVSFFAIVLAEHVEKNFGAFKKQYNKKYQTIPEVLYYKTFKSITKTLKA